MWTKIERFGYFGLGGGIVAAVLQFTDIGKVVAGVGIVVGGGLVLLSIFVGKQKPIPPSA